MLSAAELAASLPGAVIRGDAAARFTSVCSDSRQVRPGCLFVALLGERFDGHAFVADAVRNGASVALVEQPVDAAVAQVIVPNSRRALGLAAAAWRARFRLPLIAVTGSNGKTTVTQMLAGILARAFGPTRRLATRGNLNNDIGLPLMLFELAAGHKAAVLELGMNHPGEIAYLAQLAQPTVALVNNAQREHQEFLGSVEATARENGAAIAALPPEGIAVFPADDPCAPIWRNLAGTRRIIDFAQAADATVTAEHELQDSGARLEIVTPAGLIRTRLAVPGLHNVHNALAACAAALAVDVPPGAIAAGLAMFTAVDGRGVQSRTAGGAALIDDSYNANPDSVRAAIDLLAGAGRPRILVLGDMGEVGGRGADYHREVGTYAKSRGIDVLLGTGPAMRDACAAFGAGAEHFDDVEALRERAQELAQPGATLLVKGSRFMRMERVVAALGAATAGAH
ncbi:MAG: UDP-N-acetylmuramoyl-tripeptide--D-alanyl-D-alanine ligase [Burkholderiales bacterium]|nr:MAG: UDP-N-acetylmuramoyl-tripeptide--D-alanyl-D-alanine ligase [Burkholderiales bacterium]